MWWNLFYTYAFIYFITYVKLVDGCSTNGFTATFIAGVSTKIWHCRVIGVLVLWMTNRWQLFFLLVIPYHWVSNLFMNCGRGQSVVDSYFKNWRVVACVTRTRGRELETSTKAMHFWKSGFKLAFGRNKKVRFLEFLVSWINWVNLMMCVHKTKRFYAVRYELLLPLKIRVTEDCVITFIHY